MNKNTHHLKVDLNGGTITVVLGTPKIGIKDGWLQLDSPEAFRVSLWDSNFKLVSCLDSVKDAPELTGRFRLRFVTNTKEDVAWYYKSGTGRSAITTWKVNLAAAVYEPEAKMLRKMLGVRKWKLEPEAVGDIQ